VAYHFVAITEMVDIAIYGKFATIKNPAIQNPKSKMNSSPNPLDAVSSPDINAERLAALKRLFPDLFSNEGRLNVDELKKVVDPALVTESERYDFRWYGKTASKREAFTPSRAALIYDPARSVNPDKAGGNIIIEGENLEVLKLLNCAYRERVKCIYIDPPYNTGKDFVYSDRFASGQKPYWEQTGVTENGVKVDSNSDSDGRFHSNWLSMMHSRLLAARYLLQPDGVIFVSIDDNEVQNLRRVMDEVFGEENFIAEIVWQKMDSPSRNAEDRAFSNYHEYIVAFARDIDYLGISPENRISILDAYPLTLPDGRKARRRQLRKNGKNARREDRPTMWYPLEAPDGTEVFPVAPEGWEGRWVLKKEEWLSRKEQKLAEWIKRDHGWMPYYIEVAPDTPTAPWSTLWTDVGQNRQAKAEFTSLMGSAVEFQTPKPSALISKIVQMCTNEGDIILDFFAGSGTTAQGVMSANSEDQNGREFILIQLPELITEGSVNYRAGYKKISDITIERNKRVIEVYKKGAEDRLPGDTQRQFAESLGFKVYTLAKSRFPRVEFAPDPEKTEAENVEALKRYIAEKESSFHIQLDKAPVRDEVLLKQGFMFDYTLTPQPAFTKNEVVLVRDANKESLLCLDAVIAPETVDYFQTRTDRFFICLELALDTTKKWNLKHHLGDKLKTV